MPDFNSLYNEVVAYVKEHQGEKGFIDCRHSHNADIIYAIVFDYDYDCGIEQFVYAVRVVNNDLEVLLEPVVRSYRVVYQPEDFTSEEAEEKWQSVKGGDVYYALTIFNIAESIEQYVEE